MKVNPQIPKTPSHVKSYMMGAADFVPKNGIFGINGITMVFCDCSTAALNGCPRVRPQINDKNDKISKNTL